MSLDGALVVVVERDLHKQILQRRNAVVCLEHAQGAAPEALRITPGEAARVNIEPNEAGWRGSDLPAFRETILKSESRLQDCQSFLRAAMVSQKFGDNKISRGAFHRRE